VLSHPGWRFLRAGSLVCLGQDYVSWRVRGALFPGRQRSCHWGGPIGQMSIRWARAAGCACIIAADTAAHRLPLAKDGGATALVTSAIGEARAAVLAAGGGKQPRVVIDSTGNATVLPPPSASPPIGHSRFDGDTGTPTRQALTSDVIMRGLTIVGAHDAHDSNEWNGATIRSSSSTLLPVDDFP